MPDELETILRLVADGALTPEEAAPLIDAVHATRRTAATHEAGSGARMAEGQRPGRQLRIRITERGRQVVNLRIPLGFADAALRAVPGISGEQGERIREALRAGAVGPLVDVEDEAGDTVLISVE